MKFNDAIPGALFLVLGISTFVYAGGFTRFPGIPYGPGLFPRIIAVMMGGGGLMLMLSGLRAADRAPWITLADWARNPRSYVLFFSVIGAVLFYIVLSGTLGFLLCGSLMLTGLLTVTRGYGSVVSSAVIAVVVTILIHLVFAEMLRVPLPFGVIERWLV